MKKNIMFVAMIGLAMSLFIACESNTGQDDATSQHEHEHDGEKHKHGHDGEHDHEHHGKKGGKPPKGKGGSPMQTKTLEEIGGYKIGEVATDFSLKGVDGSMVSLESMKNAKGYIVTFTCNECPFAKMYEDRLIELNNTYAAKGYPVIAINPNSPENEKEGYEAMQTRAKEKGFTFPYLVDEGQEIYPKYGAVRTPHVFLLDKDRKVQYIGAIDDNAKSPEDVKEKYLENAIAALEKGEKPSPNLTKAIGCPVKPSKK